MTETLLQAVPEYGALIVFLATLLSCLAMPIPTSLILLTAGAFVASEDLTAISTATAALAGAVAGDQTGYQIARSGSGLILRRTAKAGKTADMLARARALTDRWGDAGVFFSRWLFSPLGPYVNFASGIAGMDRFRFTLWGAAGEAVWVALYLGLGYVFGSQLEAVLQILGNLSGALAGAALTIGLALTLRAALKADSAKADRKKETHDQSAGI